MKFRRSDKWWGRKPLTLVECMESTFWEEIGGVGTPLMVEPHGTWEQLHLGGGESFFTLHSSAFLLAQHQTKGVGIGKFPFPQALCWWAGNSSSCVRESQSAVEWWEGGCPGNLSVAGTLLRGRSSNSAAKGAESKWETSPGEIIEAHVLFSKDD